MKEKDFNMLKLNLQYFAEEKDETLESDDEEIKDEQVDDEKQQSEEDNQEQFVSVKELQRRLKQKEQEKEDAVNEAKKLAKMNKEQKADYEREQMEKELEQLRTEKQLNEMRSEARSMFKDKDINASDELLDIVVASDAEKTKSNIDSLASILNDLVQEKVKASLRTNTPKSFNGNGLSKNEILSIKDDSQRQMAIAQNMHLFK